MPRMVITHDVVEIERWLKGKDERASALEQVGSDVTDHVAADGSNRIAVSATIHDMAALQAMLDAPPPEVAALMESHGVVPPFTVYIEP
ncbi:hypothetical protein GCM10009623_18190 [Nocardioides aestuarii]|uniref:DUF4242 domain-containing protein n=1 Tax=Nocardioides aestuarii TaxID=252231 RepID=A0ABW4TLZ4_9ACTN